LLAIGRKGSEGKGIVEIWDLSSGKATRTFELDLRGVGPVGFSGDGRSLVAASGYGEGQVVVWNLVTGERKAAWSGVEPLTKDTFLSYRFGTVSLSPDGSLLATGCDVRKVRTKKRGKTKAEKEIPRAFLLDVKTGKRLKTWEGCSSVAFWGDGDKLLVKSAGGLMLCGVKGEEEQRVQGGVLSPDGAMAASATEDGVVLRDAATGNVTRSWVGYRVPLKGVRFGDAGTRLTTAVSEKTALVWDLKVGGVIQEEETETGAPGRATSRDGRLTVQYDYGGGYPYDPEHPSLTLHDRRTRSARRLLNPPLGRKRFHEHEVAGVAFGQDGKSVVAAINHVTEAGAGVGKWIITRSIVIVWAVPETAAASDAGTKPRGIPPAGAVEIIPTTNTEYPSLIAKYQARWLPKITMIRLSPDGVRVALGRADWKVDLWNLHTGLQERSFQGHGGSVETIEFSPDGRKLASGAKDGNVILWDIGSETPEAILRGHWAAVNAVAFSPDGRTLASASEDGTAIVWRLGDCLERSPRRALAGLRALAGTLMGRNAQGHMGDTGGGPDTPRAAAILLPLKGGKHWVMAAPEGYYACSLEASRYVVWRVGMRVYPFDEFEEQYRRPDLLCRALAGEDISHIAQGATVEPPIEVAFESSEHRPHAGSNGVLEATIRAAGDNPICGVELSYNGEPASGKLARSLRVERPGETERTFRISVATPKRADLRLRAVACDALGNRSRPAELFWRNRPTWSSAPEGLLVLSIGVSRYKNDAWNTIAYADEDALSFADYFGRQREDATLRVLTNEKATVSNVKFALRWLKDTATETDTAAVFVAGHGVQQGSDDYYFLCHDSDEADLEKTAMPWRDFVKMLRDVRGSVLLFADTCHSGFVTGADVTRELIGRLNEEAGVVVFAASQGDEASVERDDWGHGAFTKALLEGLEGKADTEPQDGSLTIQELREYVIARVEDLTGGAQHPYLPRLEQLQPRAVIALAAAPEAMPYVGHEAPVISVAFSPDGGRLVSAGHDRKVIIWDVADGFARAVFDTHHDPPNSVCFSPDGKMVAACTGVRLRVVNRVTDKLERVIRTRRGQSLSRREWRISGAISVWSVGARELLSERSLPACCRSVCFSADGARIVCLGAGRSASNLFIADPQSPDKPRKLETPSLPTSAFSLSFTLDGAQLAVGSEKGLAVFPSIITELTDSEISGLRYCHRLAARMLHLPEGELGSAIESEKTPVTSVAVSPDSTALAMAIGKGAIALWDLVASQTARTLKGPKARIQSLSFSPDGELLAAGAADNTVIIWDLEGLGPTRTLEGHDGAVNSVSFSPDGKTLASASSDKTIILWDVETGRPRKVLRRRDVDPVAGAPADAQKWSRTAWGLAHCAADSCRSPKPMGLTCLHERDARATHDLCKWLIIPRFRLLPAAAHLHPHPRPRRASPPPAGSPRHT
jgi:WD40 repeat protein